MSRYANAPAPRSTCPWGDGQSDSHTLQSEKANRRREANYQGVRPTQPWSSVASPKKAEQSLPPSQAEIEAEKMDFIQQCFDKGMTEDQVYEALDQYEAPLREMTGLEQKVIENNTLADKRAQKSKISDALVGKFDAEESRSAFLESQTRAQQARDRNRCGSGIF